MTTADVLFARDGAVAIVTLNRPARRNTLTDGMLEALGEIEASIEDDASVGAVVLTGTGPLFCGGFDVTGGAPRSGRRAFQAHADLASRTLWGIWRSRLPWVAAVRGLCLGGGVYLAGVCDFLLTTDRTRFTMAEVKFGFAPPLFNVFPWLMGLRAAKEFLMTGDPVAGARAVEMGLATRAVADETLDDEAMRLARSLARMPDDVVRTLKRSINARWEAAGFVAGIERDVERFVENKVFQGPVQQEYRRLAREIGGRAALERLGIDIGLPDLDAAP